MKFYKNLISCTFFIIVFTSSLTANSNVPSSSDSQIAIIKSLIHPQTINTFIRKNYVLEEPVNCTILNTGVNDIYLIETKNKKFIVRLSGTIKSSMMSSNEFLFELEWLDFLNYHHLPVSYPIRRIDGTLFGIMQAPEGPRFITLFSFAEGTEDLNEKQAFILGKNLAHIHAISDYYETDLPRQNLGIDELIKYPVQKIKSHLGEGYKEQFATLDNFAVRIEQKILSLDLYSGSYGIIAGDVHGYNQHFTSDNKLTLFDFEFCAYGYRLYDIATFKWSRGSDNLPLWNAFLQGYQSVWPLSDAEIEVTDVFVEARNLWWVGCMLDTPEFSYKLDKTFWKNFFSKLNSPLEILSNSTH